MDRFIKIDAFNYNCKNLTCFRFNVSNIESYYEINTDSDSNSVSAVHGIVIVSNSEGRKLFFKDKKQRDLILIKLDYYLDTKQIEHLTLTDNK